MCMTHLMEGAMMRTLGEKPETDGSDDVSGEKGAGEMMSYADTSGWKIIHVCIVKPYFSDIIRS